MIIPVTAPNGNPVEIYDFAISKRRRLLVKKMLSDVRPEVVAAYDSYVESSVCTSGTSSLTFKDEVKEALQKNYDLTYAGGPLEHLRDDLMDTSFIGLCAMCGHAKASTLDHYLPKEKYPEYSILALNLIPSCADCNHSKLSFVGSESGRFFHAYQDDLSAVDSILRSKVHVDGDELIVEFFVNSELEPEVYKNALVQFQELNLADRYMLSSKQELLDRHFSFDEAYISGGRDMVAATARKQLRSLRRIYGNHYWKAALYDAVGKSSDFCEGGYSLIIPS